MGGLLVRLGDGVYGEIRGLCRIFEPDFGGEFHE